MTAASAPAHPPEPPDPADVHPVRAKARGRLRRLIAKLHDWAESGWAGAATGTWGLLQGSVVPGPSDALLIPLGLADPPRVFTLAVWATAGSTVGALIAYTIGVLAFDTVGQWMLNLVGVSAHLVQSQRTRFESHGAYLVALSAVSPIPTKIVCMAAGAFGVPLPAFFVAIFAGRAARFLGLAVVVRFAGEWISRKLGLNGRD